MQIFVSKDGQQLGPYTSEQIQSFLSVGHFLPTDLMWYEGLGDWQPIANLFPSQEPAPIVPQFSTPAAAPVSPVQADQNYPAIPSRPTRPNRPISASQERRRSPLLASLIVVIGIVVIWLGTTLIFSLITKSQFEEGFANSKIIELKNYKMGLFSSSALTALHFGDEELMEDEDNPFVFVHKINHGPVSLVDKKPKFGAAIVTTKLNWRDNNDKLLPLAALSEVNFSRQMVNSIVFEPIDFKYKGGGHLVFDGGKISLTSNPDLTHFTGSMDISPITYSDSNGEFKIDAFTGDLEYYTSGYLDLTASLGGIRLEFEQEDAGNHVFLIAPPKLSVSINHQSDDLPLYVGKSSIKFPEIRAEGLIQGLLTDIEFSSRSYVDTKNNFNASAKYEIGKVRIGSEDEPVFDLTGATSIEHGFKGVNAPLLVKLNQTRKDFYGPLFKPMVGLEDRSPSPLSSPVSQEKLVSEMLMIWLDMIRPGVEIYTKLRFSDSDAALDLSAKYGGRKKLTDAKTLREVATAIEANLNLRVAGELRGSPLFADGIDSAIAEGYGILKGDAFMHRSAIRKGIVFFGDDATDLLETAGPDLDNPIDWDTILATIQSGTKAE